MAKRKMAVIAALLCLLLLPGYVRAASTADAEEPISTDRACTLTVAYRYDGKSFSDLPVNLYKIAAVSADFQYRLAAPFADSGLILDGVQTVGEWNVIRTTLEAYILANGVTADLTGVTDQEGQVCFRDLKPGLYLATTESVHLDGWSYTFDSALVAVPSLGGDGLWQYETAVTAKASATPPSETDEEVEYKVLKLWKGDSGRSDRPESVEVEIFREGVSHQTVTLSEENHWSYSWKTKDDGATWMVVERNVPAGYTMTIEERETAFVLTNSRIPEEPDPPEPSTEPSTPDETTVPGSTTQPEIPPEEPPKTGDTTNVLVYIVLMFVSGTLLILLAVLGKRK